jgi:hypothetical protein
MNLSPGEKRLITSALAMACGGPAPGAEDRGPMERLIDRLRAAEPDKTDYARLVDYVVRGVVGVVEAAGGLYEDDPDVDGSYRPYGEPDWTDLAEVYLAACRALGQAPMVDHAGEGPAEDTLDELLVSFVTIVGGVAVSLERVGEAKYPPWTIRPLAGVGYRVDASGREAADFADLDVAVAHVLTELDDDRLRVVGHLFLALARFAAGAAGYVVAGRTVSRGTIRRGPTGDAVPTYVVVVGGGRYEFLHDELHLAIRQALGTGAGSGG